MFSLIVCCLTLNVTLEKDVKDKWGHLEGVYTFQGFSQNGGNHHWVDSEGLYAIRCQRRDPNSAETCPTYWCFIGYLSVLLSDTSPGTSHLISPIIGIGENKCPNTEGWSWKFHKYQQVNWWYDHESFNLDIFNFEYIISTNDVDIKCASEDDSNENFCTSENPCGTDQGDCDTDDECQDGLFCGSNNCPDSLGFHSEFDCCYNSTVGDEHFCTTDNPCAVDEGDCDSDNECQTNHICDTVNSCPEYLGFAFDVNCCSVGCK